MNTYRQFVVLASVIALALSITIPTTAIRVQSAFATEPKNITTTQPANITINEPSNITTTEPANITTNNIR